MGASAAKAVADIVITHVFRASRATVFDAWTKPEHVAQWWDPARLPLASCEIDLRPGGRFRFVHGGPTPHTFAGTYRAIEPPTRLVFATMAPSGVEAVGTIVLSEREGRTTLTLSITCASPADRDAMLRIGVDTGTRRTLENLDGYLARHQ